jgi:hypothetical protein
MDLKNGVIDIQTAGYNVARTVLYLMPNSRYNLTGIDLFDGNMNSILTGLQS